MTEERDWFQIAASNFLFYHNADKTSSIEFRHNSLMTEYLLLKEAGRELVEAMVLDGRYCLACKRTDGEHGNECPSWMFKENSE